MAVAGLTAGAAPSRAAFPGTNGRLLISRFEDGWDYVRATRADGRVGARIGRGYHAAWSPDGRRIAFSDPDLGGLFVVPADGRVSPSHLSLGLKPSWSPDGRRIAFLYLQAGSPPQVHTIAANARLGPGRAVTTDRRVKYTPAWSPDGRWIAYGVGDDRFSDDLYLIHPDGSGERQLTSGPGLDDSASWSPDGKRIAFARFEPGTGRRIFSVHVTSGTVTQLTSEGRELDPVWSPDGHRIAFGRYDGPLPAPWMMDSDGGNEQRLTELGPRDHVLDWQRTIDLGVTQRAARLGRRVRITIVVRNASPGPSVGARLVYSAPARARLVSAPRACRRARTIVCPLRRFGPRGSVVLRFVLHVRGPAASRASVVTRQVDPRPADNRSTIHVRASRTLAQGQQSGWERHPPIPLPRTEVAAATANAKIVVVGGFVSDGSTTARADEYTPSTRRWRRLPDLPAAVNHAMAASWNGRVYIVGGYSGSGRAGRGAFVLERGDWRRLPQLPAPRAAAGAAVVGGRLYVAGGVTENLRGTRSLARDAFVFDLRRRRWSTIPGPTPREHLAVAAVRGRVYVLAGRLAGIDTNLRALERYAPASRRWLRLPPIPSSRGGTGAAGVGRLLVSIGGEAPRGTIASVYAFDVSTRRWRRLADLPTPRHGLGVVTLGQRVYAIAGGPRPGLTVSEANESLRVP